MRFALASILGFTYASTAVTDVEKGICGQDGYPFDKLYSTDVTNRPNYLLHQYKATMNNNFATDMFIPVYNT